MGSEEAFFLITDVKIELVKKVQNANIGQQERS